MGEKSLNMEALLGSKLLSASGEVSTTEALSGKKAIALYFSAHWCPPCRGFTPQFAKWYEDDLKGKGLEVVFVSSDQDEASFKEYFGEMPWLALPYGDERKETLSKSSRFVESLPLQLSTLRATPSPATVVRPYLQTLPVRRCRGSRSHCKRSWQAPNYSGRGGRAGG